MEVALTMSDDAEGGRLMSLVDERDELRRRWYEAGFFGTTPMADRMEATARRFPDTWMIIHGEHGIERTNLAELFEASGRVAAGLWRCGLRPGDGIGIQVPNRLEGFVLYQAAMRLGLVVIPIIHIYGPAEVSFILRQSEAKALVIPDRWRSVDYLERLDALSDLPALDRVIVIGDDRPSDTIAWSELMSADPTQFTAPAVDPDTVSLLVYTSGTTADPKGVQHTHNTLLAETEINGAATGVAAGDVSLAAFPAGHIAGVLNLLRLTVSGLSSVVLDTFEPVLAARLVHEHRAVSSAGAPFYLQTMLAAAADEKLDLSSLRNYMVGAASVPPQLVEDAQRVGVVAYRAYGSSEHPVLTTGVAEDPLEARAGTDGRLTAGNEVRIVDDDGRDLPVGVDGEIWCRGPEQFVGYRDRALDDAAFSPGAWFATGDIGRMDVDGYLTITDRKKDIIIRGGENIASKEVEDVLARHRSVAEAAVIGMPDDRYGERVCAFVIGRPGEPPLDLDTVRAHFVEAGIARQKTPERIIVVDELPRGMSGKVKKFELRRQVRD